MWGEPHSVLLQVWDPQTLSIIRPVVGDPESSVEEAPTAGPLRPYSRTGAVPGWALGAGLQ